MIGPPAEACPQQCWCALQLQCSNWSYCARPLRPALVKLEQQEADLQGAALQHSMSASDAKAPDRRMALHAWASSAPSRISVAAA